MTNEQIIWQERVQLMERGIIGDTGNEVIVQDENGKPKALKEPEEIHTYQAWKENGRQVRKGEHAVGNCVIWKHTVKKAAKEEDSDEERIFQTRAYFFTKSQTDMIENDAKEENTNETADV